MADSFSTMAPGLGAPYTRAAAVTPHDDNDLAEVTRGIYVGGAGNLRVITSGGDTVTLTAVAVGVLHPLRVQRVLATLTTATNIIGVW